MTLHPAAYILLGVAIGHLLDRLRKHVATSKEVAKIRVQQQDALADAQMAMAHTWLAATPVCPDCKTNDGRRVCYIYCHDPHLWHAANCNFGTYKDKTQRYALLEIGKKLWAKQGRSYAGPIAAKVEGK